MVTLRHMRRALSGLALAFAGLAALGVAGAVHPALDSLAVFRGALVWGALGAALAALLVAVLAAQGAVMALAQVPRGQIEGPRIDLYQQNLLYSRGVHDGFVAHIRRHGIDVLTLQEVSAPNRAILAALSDEFPARVLCDTERAVGGVAVLSRFPLLPGTTVCGEGLALVQVQTPAGPLWAGSVHLHWPWPYDQADQVAAIAPLIAALDGPRVLAGDFNQVAWSAALARVLDALDGRRVGRRAATFSLPFGGLRIGIDHVIAGPGQAGRIEVEPGRGSDHNGVYAVVEIGGG